MTEPEKELLHRILIDLFLATPRKRTVLLQQQNNEEGQKKQLQFLRETETKHREEKG